MISRKRVHEILDPEHHGDLASRLANYFIYAVIFLNVVAIVMESVPSIRKNYVNEFHCFELVSVAIFSCEYLLRLWSCVEIPRFSSPIVGRLRYMVSALAIVDLLAILPCYLPFIHADLIFLRTIRLFRLFRLAKLGRYSTAIQLLAHVVYSRRSELMVTLFVVLVMAVMTAVGIYYAEGEAQPGIFPDIPTAMLWAVAALTNNSHVDPITPVGKFLASLISLMGVGMVALPTGILGAGFVEQIQSRNKPRKKCPHCGKEIDP